MHAAYQNSLLNVTPHVRLLNLRLGPDWHYHNCFSRSHISMRTFKICLYSSVVAAQAYAGPPQSNVQYQFRPIILLIYS